MKRYFLGIMSTVTWLIVGCNSSVPVPTPPVNEPPVTELLRDVTRDSGIDFTYHNGEEANHLAIIESLGGGVALLDYDNDGLLDIFFPGGGYFDRTKVLGHPGKLYRNLGGMKFQDVSVATGLAGPLQYSHGAAAFDYDNDGWLDLLVTGYARLVLLHNEPDGVGGRKFVDVTTKAGLLDTLWSSTAAWGDLDGDGFADLYISHYGDWGFETNHPTDCSYDTKVRDVCQPKRFKALPHTIYRNNRNSTFMDITASLNLRKDGKGMGVMMVDLNRDGRPDIYVANDTDPNFLYMNRGKPGEIVLEEIGMTAGVALDDRGQANGSMGLAVADFDHTGFPSIVVTNYEKELPALYKKITNQDRFQFATSSSQLSAIGASYVSWGVGFLDYNHDGWEDLFIANGHAIRYPSTKIGREQRPVLVQNNRGKFTPVTGTAGPYFQTRHNARGAAFGDLDNDGKIDVVVSHVNAPAVVLHNVADTKPNHWLGIELRGKGNRDVVGARVVLESASGSQTRFISSGASFASTNDPRCVFGLGLDSEPVAKITVYWPSGGAEQAFKNLVPDRYWKLSEGQ